jgi:hypothetical protein
LKVKQEKIHEYIYILRDTYVTKQLARDSCEIEENAVCRINVESYVKEKTKLGKALVGVGGKDLLSLL